jgi:hypothetical protein
LKNSSLMPSYIQTLVYPIRPDLHGKSMTQPASSTMYIRCSVLWRIFPFSPTHPMHHRCYRAEKGQSQYGTFLPLFFAHFLFTFVPSRPPSRSGPRCCGKKKRSAPQTLVLYLFKKLQPYTARAYIVTLKWLLKKDWNKTTLSCLAQIGSDCICFSATSNSYPWRFWLMIPTSE